MFLIVAVLLCLSTVRGQQPSLQVYEFPVGQGDATGIRCPNGEWSFVDLGSSSRGARCYWGSVEIANTVRDIGMVKHIFITHKDTDHNNLINATLRNHPNPKRVNMYASTTVSTDMRKSYPQFKHTGVRKCAPGECTDSFRICDGIPIFMEIVASELGTPNNENGLVFRLRYATFSMLFVGDVSEPSSANQLLAQPGKIKSDVYKLGHHGTGSIGHSETNTAGFLDEVKPKVVLSSGDPWYHSRYRHPRCSSLRTAFSCSTVAKPGTHTTVNFKPQNEYSCGEERGGVISIEEDVAVYTHAPSENDVQLVVITYNYDTRSIVVGPRPTSGRYVLRRSIDSTNAVCHLSPRPSSAAPVFKCQVWTTFIILVITWVTQG